MNPLIQEINTAEVAVGSVRIWWIGQEGFVFKTRDRIIYIDPYLSDFGERITRGRANEHVRINPAPMRPQDVDHADIVLCTHDHGDHIDPDGLPLIARASPRAQFLVPECARETLRGFGIADERIHALRGNDSGEVAGVTVHAIPAKHEAFDEHPFNGFPYLSYVLELEGRKILHAGDTIPYPGQADRVHAHAVDLALLPINGRDDFRHALGFQGNFTCEEAVGFALAIKAGLTIPMHYDTFTLNTADVRDFQRIANHRGLRHLVMKHAGCIEFPLGGSRE